MVRAVDQSNNIQPPQTLGTSPQIRPETSTQDVLVVSPRESSWITDLLTRIFDLVRSLFCCCNTDEETQNLPPTQDETNQNPPPVPTNQETTSTTPEIILPITYLPGTDRLQSMSAKLKEELLNRNFTCAEDTTLAFQRTLEALNKSPKDIKLSFKNTEEGFDFILECALSSDSSLFSQEYKFFSDNNWTHMTELQGTTKRITFSCGANPTDALKSHIVPAKNLDTDKLASFLPSNINQGWKESTLLSALIQISNLGMDLNNPSVFYLSTAEETTTIKWTGNDAKDLFSESFKSTAFQKNVFVIYERVENSNLLTLTPQ